METYTLPATAYPADLQQITLALFADLPDAGALRERLIKAPSMDEAERRQLDFAFLNPKLIASRDQVLTAAHQAILSAAQGELRTQTVHSELIDHLNPTSNIGEGLRRFGINAKSTSVLLVRVGRRTDEHEREALEKHMTELTQGRLASLDPLERDADVASLSKYYKTGADAFDVPGYVATCSALNKTVGIF